ncbi:hypothetical protein [Citreimonas salinaria]|uniref:Apolipoprotein N-acyltransferase n=1 Tax=Citreimonas salinaria TaxID=321339 RepID=A0A1H3EY49_9RHOB|nr:apolipoprotein N-acyltransferase [Citreimonas salinaria]
MIWLPKSTCCARANTGVSASIDGAGRVLASLDLGQVGYADAPLPPPLRVTADSRTGDWPLAGAIAAALVLGRRKSF